MLRFLLSACLSVLASGLHAAEPDYIPDVKRWQEVAVPPAVPRAQRLVWSEAAARSGVEWRVYVDGGKALATRVREKASKRPENLGFIPITERFRGGSAFAAVDDGWLVGFNHGEFGAALYWFSQDGKLSYKISDHQVVDFVSAPDGIYAVEGLAHMGISRGSVIRISRPTSNSHWIATNITVLPFAPCAVSLRKDGTMLITLSDSIVSLDPDHKLHTLFADRLWRQLYANSSIISPDETKLYIGMRQYVVEFDLTTNEPKFLIPSQEFLNKLPQGDEDRLRRRLRD